jgi:predicted metalloprotease with PDZ domain
VLILPDRLAADLGLQVVTTRTALKIATVLAGGGAESAGLRSGDVILAVDGQPRPA